MLGFRWIIFSLFEKMASGESSLRLPTKAFLEPWLDLWCWCRFKWTFASSSSSEVACAKCCLNSSGGESGLEGTLECILPEFLLWATFEFREPLTVGLFTTLCGRTATGESDLKIGYGAWLDFRKFSTSSDWSSTIWPSSLGGLNWRVWEWAISPSWIGFGAWNWWTSSSRNLLGINTVVLGNSIF